MPKADPGVAAFIDALEHPLKPAVVALCKVVLAVDPSIREAVKWNAPSFCTTEHFATMNLRKRDELLLILHLGAKKRALPKLAIDDPQRLLQWLGADRAAIPFADARDVAAKAPALRAIVRQWMDYA